MFARIYTARETRGKYCRALYGAVADVPRGVAFVRIENRPDDVAVRLQCVDRLTNATSGGDVRALASCPDYDPNTITENYSEMTRDGAAVFVDECDVEVSQPSPDGVAEHDEVEHWHDEGHHEQCRSANELSELALDNGE